MLVDNRTQYVKTMPVQDREREKDGKEGKFLPHQRTVTLMPGVNDVADGDWEKVKTLGTIKGMLHVEQLKELDNRPFAKRTEPEALKIVAATVDRKLLERWREDEREEVREAVKAQLKKVSPGTKDEK